jgi:hypothetical protein
MILNHPIKDLSLHGNLIVRRATSGDSSVPYMSETQMVLITRAMTDKMSDPDADGYVKYPLGLSVAPDYVWSQLLAKRKGNLRTRLEENTLTFQCHPETLKKQYALLKDAVTLTNQDYAEEKRQLLELLKNDLDAESKAAEEANRERAKLQKDFGDLEL